MKNALMKYRLLSELAVGRGEELVKMTVLGESEDAKRLRMKLVSEMKDLANCREKVVNIVDSLEDERYRVVLSLRYLTGLEWDEIEKRLGYSKRHLYRIHDEGMKAFEEKYMEKEKE